MLVGAVWKRGGGSEDFFKKGVERVPKGGKQECERP